MYAVDEIKQMRRDYYQRAAIIAYYRMGAPVHIITLIAGIEHYEVETIIKDYKNQQQLIHK